MIKTITITADMCDKELLLQGTIKLLEPIEEECNVIIPENIDGIKITSIGDYAFLNCNNITSINIPDSVTSIGDSVFGSCTSLTSITIPDSVTSIGSWAFASCVSLTSITIPDSVTSINYGTFSGCKNLVSVNIPDSVTSIGDNAICDCVNLVSITIPDSVTSIGDYTFDSCKNLKSITIPKSVTFIGNYTFYECRNLTIIYEGNAEQLNKLFTSSEIKEQVNKDNILVIFVKDIKDYINRIENGLEYSIFEMSNLVYKECLLKELDSAINNTTDLNKKIKLLTVRNDIDKQPIYINNDDIEK